MNQELNSKREYSKKSKLTTQCCQFRLANKNALVLNSVFVLMIENITFVHSQKSEYLKTQFYSNNSTCFWKILPLMV